MRHTTAILLACLIAGGAVACSEPRTYDEIVTDCYAALKERPEGDVSKPDACEGIKAKDYDTLVLGQIIDDLGWTDDEGRFDENKMLEDLQR